MTADHEQPRRPARAGPRTMLGVFATASFFYPLLLCVALYGEWLFAWSVLGHEPRPPLDDPGSIPELRYLDTAASLLLLGLLPAGGVALVLQFLHARRLREPAEAVALRVGAVLVAWCAVVGLMAWDPGRVFDWWID